MNPDSARSLPDTAHTLKIGESEVYIDMNPTIGDGTIKITV